MTRNTIAALSAYETIVARPRRYTCYLHELIDIVETLKGEIARLESQLIDDALTKMAALTGSAEAPMSGDLTQRAEPYLRLGSYGVDLIRDLLAEVARLRAAMREWLAASDESMTTDDDVASMLRYGKAVDDVRAILRKSGDGGPTR